MEKAAQGMFSKLYDYYYSGYSNSFPVNRMKNDDMNPDIFTLKFQPHRIRNRL